jgi:hypothetical protein
MGAVPPDQDRLAEALVVEGIGGAGDLRLLAFGEDDALGRIAHLGEDGVQPAGHGIEPARQPRHVAVQVDDRPAGDAGGHRRLGDGDRTLVIRRGSNGAG